MILKHSTAELLHEKAQTAAANLESASVRAAPGYYLSALFPATFAAALLFYLEYNAAAAVVFLAAWIVLPVCLWTDRVAFDGKRISRSGVLPKIWAFLSGARTRLKLSDIEQAETQTLRALKRGGNVFYHYRTTLRGKGAAFVFGSTGGEDYRRMVRRIFSLLPENALDTRSLELRDYLTERKETLMKAEFAHIPSVQVLESYFAAKRTPQTKTAEIDNPEANAEKNEKADYLHRLGNELRLSGYLLQALEAFRRALVVKPHEARLVFDFARCLNSFADSQHNQRLQKKSLAALRLAEKRAGNDSELLERLGESYFQFGDFARAQKVFRKVLDSAGESFRAVRGLAEIALRDGKIAHVIHQFSIADRLAETPALRRWAKTETEYFSRLNESDEYMEMEISRINLLETLEKSRKTALRLTLAGFPAILLGILFEENQVANLGWAVSGVALVVWTFVVIAEKMLAERLPYDFEDEED